VYLKKTSRWTAKDPIGFNGGDTNLHGYILALADPLRDKEAEQAG
jgi:hypothetical protein